MMRRPFNVFERYERTNVSAGKRACHSCRDGGGRVTGSRGTAPALSKCTVKPNVRCADGQASQSGHWSSRCAPGSSVSRRGVTKTDSFSTSPAPFMPLGRAVAVIVCLRMGVLLWGSLDPSRVRGADRGALGRERLAVRRPRRGRGVGLVVWGHQVG